MLFEGGYFFINADGLIGRFEKFPPQFGHTFFNKFSTQSLQKVHSKVQIIASLELNGNDLLQCSHVGLMSNIFWLIC